MEEENKAILEEANAKMAAGDTEGFLAFCSDDTEWTYVGETTLKGKEAVRQYLAVTNTEPPRFTVTKLITEGDYLTALGEITMSEDGKDVRYAYADVWRFRDGKMVELQAFVIKSKTE